MFLPPDPDPEYTAMLDYEAKAERQWEDPGCDAFDRSPERIDRLADVMEREDYGSFDEDGWVR